MHSGGRSVSTTIHKFADPQELKDGQSQSSSCCCGQWTFPHSGLKRGKKKKLPFGGFLVLQPFQDRLHNPPRTLDDSSERIKKNLPTESLGFLKRETQDSRKFG
jgi:hypothetical protein